MHSYTVYLCREEDGALYREAQVRMSHLVPPQFIIHSHSTLSVEQALSLLELAARGAKGERFRIDLSSCEEVAPHPDAAPSQGPENS